MKKLIAVALVCLAAIGAVAAQDWRTDEENGLRYNCELVGALVADFGDEALIRTASGAKQGLADFLNYLFPLCVEQDRGRLSEMIESDEESIVVVLYDEVKHAWGEPECSILIDDFYDDDFTFLSGGRALDGIAVDVYLPGENQPVVMDDTLTSVTASGLPIRRQWLMGDDFPLGEYVFDVYIEGELFHFVWDRRDNAMNTFSLVCHPHEDEADAGEADGEMAATAAEASDVAAAEDAAVAVDEPLQDEEKARIPGTDCLVWTEAWDVDLNILIIGQNQEDISVDLYFPGDSEPQKLDGHNLNEFDDGTPYRIEWIESESLPLGLYHIEVMIEGQLYQYQWQREDASVNTFGVQCITIEDE